MRPFAARALFAILGLAVLGLAFGDRGKPPRYDPDPARWPAVAVPSRADPVVRAVWDHAGNGSKTEWRVSLKSGKPRASLLDGKRGARESVSATVADGRLVAVNDGEWGGTLLWRSRDGKRQTVVSRDQVVAFFSLPDGLYAAEGLAHLSIDRGSIIRIDRKKDGSGWTTRKVADLPAAPLTTTLGRDGAVLITLSEGVVAFERGGSVRKLVEGAPWGMLYPNSSAVSPDGKRLYVGMRQYVGEVDLATKRVRLLVPSKAFLNRLSPAEERSARATAGRLGL